MGRVLISAVAGCVLGVVVLLALGLVGMALTGSRPSHASSVLATWPASFIIASAILGSIFFGYVSQRSANDDLWNFNARTIGVSALAGLLLGLVLLSVRGGSAPSEAVPEKEPVAYVLFGGAVAGTASIVLHRRLTDKANR